MSGKLLPFALAVLSFSATAATAAAHPTPPTPPTSSVDVVQTAEGWTGNTYLAYGLGQPQITMQRIDIPANVCLPWHSHPVISSTYVVSGSMQLQDQATGKTQDLVSGDAFGESVNEVHRACTGDEPVQLIRVHAGFLGQPTSHYQ